MAKVRKANVILTIKDDQVQRYVDRGFDVIGENGDVIQQSVPKDAASLGQAYKKHIAEIAALKAEIQKLKKQLKEQPKKEKPKRATSANDK